MEKTERGKTLLFRCLSCKKDVFRAGIKVNVDAKLCGYCNSRKRKPKNTTVLPPSSPQETRPDSKLTVDDVFKTVNPEIRIDYPDNKEIEGKIRTYQLLLSRVIDLLLALKEGHNETFLTLWLKAKEELRVD